VRVRASIAVLWRLKTSSSSSIIDTMLSFAQIINASTGLRADTLYKWSLVVGNPGRQYDKDGNMRQWWNNETIKAFRDRAQCMIDQYSTYRLEPLGLYVSIIFAD
jgi:hypothetical protein